MPRTRIVNAAKLRLSRDPSAELAAGALQAGEDAELAGGTADFLIVAVPAGQADDTLARALEAAVDLELDGRDVSTAA